jgi:hypothetical protein
VVAAAARELVQTRLLGFLGRGLVRGVSPAGAVTFSRISLREIGRRTGFDHRRLSEFARDPKAIPRTTMERLERLLSDPRLHERTRGLSTLRVDAPSFTQDSVAALGRPPEARRVQLVGSAFGGTDYPIGTSGWIEMPDMSKSVQTLGDAIAGVERIVFDVGAR